MNTDTRLAVNWGVAPVTTDTIRAAAIEFDNATKKARKKWEAHKHNAAQGDSVALEKWADGEAEYREVVRQARLVYFAAIGEG